RLMHIATKIQLALAVFLSLELLSLYMILIRTVANLEYAFNRVDEIIAREVQLALRAKDFERALYEKAKQVETGKSRKNDLLLNIPFMDRLSKEKRKDENA